MGIVTKKENLKYRGRDTGNIYCAKCSDRVGIILSPNYKYLELMIMCKCGEMGYIKIEKDQSDSEYLKKVDEQVLKYLDFTKSMTSVCRRCKERIFFIDQNKTFNFAFNLVCGCNKSYNLRFEGIKLKD